jgi:hypothetical protein
MRAIHAGGGMDKRTRRAALRQEALNLLVAAAVLAALSCGGGDVTPPPSTGTLEVTTSTSGAEQDPDGYSLRMDAGAVQAIGAAATLTTSDVTPGNHTVQLGEVAANCSVAGDNPRTVNVTAGQKTTVAFAVTCRATSPTTGGIRVTTVTTGASVDADGYTVSLDDGAAQTIGINATLAIADVPIGDHSVALGSVASNCTAEGANPRAVAVTAGNEAAIGFTVTCTAVAVTRWTTMSFPRTLLLAPSGPALHPV